MHSVSLNYYLTLLSTQDELKEAFSDTCLLLGRKGQYMYTFLIVTITCEDKSDIVNLSNVLAEVDRQDSVYTKPSNYH